MVFLSTKSVNSDPGAIDNPEIEVWFELTH
jgi:hypothetical protein